MGASFGTVTRAAGADISFEFDALDPSANLSGATWQIVFVCEADAVDRFTINNADIVLGAGNKLTALLTDTASANRGGNTYRVSLWRTDIPSKEPAIRGRLILETVDLPG